MMPEEGKVHAFLCCYGYKMKALLRVNCVRLEDFEAQGSHKPSARRRNLPKVGDPRGHVDPQSKVPVKQPTEARRVLKGKYL